MDFSDIPLWLVKGALWFIGVVVAPTGIVTLYVKYRLDKQLQSVVEEQKKNYQAELKRIEHEHAMQLDAIKAHRVKLQAFLPTIWEPFLRALRQFKGLTGTGNVPPLDDIRMSQAIREDFIKDARIPEMDKQQVRDAPLGRKRVLLGMYMWYNDFHRAKLQVQAYRDAMEANDPFLPGELQKRLIEGYELLMHVQDLLTTKPNPMVPSDAKKAEARELITQKAPVLRKEISKLMAEAVGTPKEFTFEPKHEVSDMWGGQNVDIG